MTMPLLNVDNLTIAFGQQHVVQNVSFTVHGRGDSRDSRRIRVRQIHDCTSGNGRAPP